MFLIIVILLIANLVFIGYYFYKIKPQKNLTVDVPNTPEIKTGSTTTLKLNEIEKLEAEKNELKEALTKFTTDKELLELEKHKFEEKNRDARLMNETAFIEKKKAEELSEKLQIEKEKMESERKKVEEKVKKLWSQSVAIHKEKERINELKLEIEKKHAEIIDSVNYAKRIQEAILPDKREITYNLPNSFILFKPRDIVSGDFYWFSNKDGKNIIATIDCTGHGVPGAFMSMIGNTLLNQIVNERGVTDPSQILNNLNGEINRSLKQTQQDSESRDGMDGAICSFEFTSAGETKDVKLQYAGANRPLYFVRNNNLEETKADKFPVGGLDYDVPKNFITHTFQLQQNDAIYIFTDGFADQFGEKDKKLMTKRFKEILISIQDKPMEEQRNYLDAFIEDWKGGREQTDDILVIGIRI